MRFLPAIAIVLPAVCAAQTCETIPWAKAASPKTYSSLQGPTTEIEPIAEVSEANKAVALKLLEKREFVQLSAQQLQPLGVRHDPGRHANVFLLRAVRIKNHFGVFKVWYQDHHIFIHFAFLGAPSGPAEPTALVAEILGKPKKLHAACSGAM
jgi:hypothetical protein